MSFAAQPYKMSFVTGGLLLNESIEVARMHEPTETWEATIQRALEVGVSTLPKAASRRRTLREIVNRISTLHDEELRYLVEGADRQDQQALLWLATCRAYRFVREFATEVIQERFLSFQHDLPLESFDVLFEAKAEWDEGLAGISATTRAKLRQVLFRMMREANIINEEGRILSAYISLGLKAMLSRNHPGDLSVFPGLTFGDEHFRENLAFIEAQIGDIRRYFTRSFYDHRVKRYKKRPIYWMFASPKGTFQALIYTHRYRPDTVSVLLNDYLLGRAEALQRDEARGAVWVAPGSDVERTPQQH